MSFKNLLLYAQAGNNKAQEEIFLMYRPLLLKHSLEKNMFDEDLYQELSFSLYQCIKKFKI